MEMLSRDARVPAPRGLLAIAGALAVLTAACVWTIDRPIARLIAAYEASGLWDRGIDGLEWVIGLPLFKLLSPVVLVAGMVITACVRRWRWQAPAWMFLAGTHLITRIVMIYGKEWTGRLRPNEWLKEGGEATFCREGGLSFPSGHVTLFGSLAIPLALLFPRARIPLVIVVAYVAAARVAVNAHFVSDTLGAITMVVATTWAMAWLVRPFRTWPR
ncbi:MAG: phosphatase PAP2 family protein [Deltaproteobacteria bacterium]|nr:phosphatase PAP2 family protein [Deltaproteobacteria bacterium]